jgi:hypothetical protein
LPSILKVIFIDPFEQNLSFTFFLLQLPIHGYNENMYTKFDHKKKNYYTIQGNKEKKIKHNNIVDYVQIRGVFRDCLQNVNRFILLQILSCQ